MELNFYDYYNDGDKLSCMSPQADYAGTQCVTIDGATAGSVVIRGSDIVIEGSTANFEYYTPEVKTQRLNPSYSPLRPIGLNRGPQDINRQTTVRSLS